MRTLLKRLSIKSVILVMLLSSCDKNSENNNSSQNDPKPKVQIISPKGSVDQGKDIQVELLFTDDAGLSNAEVRLGNLNTSINVYNLAQRGLSGKTDTLSYTVAVPAGLNVSGTNYIYVRCTDIDGNETIVDEDFEIEDKDPPFLEITAIDENDVWPGSMGFMYVDFVFEDAGGVIKYFVELWQSNPSGDLVSLLDDSSFTYPGGVTQQTTVTVDLKANWYAGMDYRIVVRAVDQSGNTTEVQQQGFIQ